MNWSWLPTAVSLGSISVSDVQQDIIYIPMFFLVESLSQKKNGFNRLTVIFECMVLKNNLCITKNHFLLWLECTRVFLVELTIKGSTFLVVCWLRLCTPDAGGRDSTPGQGTRFYMLQLNIPHAATKILCATIKTQCSQSYFFNQGYMYVIVTFFKS